MVILIAGASHVGKTLFAQKLLEKYHIPYLSIDHLKMGLIRSGNTSLTPEDDDKLREYLWPIIRETAITAIENRQNLVIEGLYIPFDWRKDFPESCLSDIRFRCLVMTESYIRANYEDIVRYSCVIENRKDDFLCGQEAMIAENKKNLRMCEEYGCEYILIDREYAPDADFPELLSSGGHMYNGKQVNK